MLFFYIIKGVIYIRLQKYLAQAGIASRRKAEELILKGEIKVNGKVITELGFQIDEKEDVVEHKGRRVKTQLEYTYIMLHKPRGYVTTVKDQFDRPTVLDLLKGVKTRVVPVGRLDYDTSGLLLLTNDGELTYTLTHPKHHIPKTYIATVKGVPKEEELDRLREGIRIENYVTSPAEVRNIEKTGTTSKIEITIHEGKNRQVRKMFDKIGYPVKKLKRISIGNIKLRNLPVGEFRPLLHDEVNYLTKMKQIKQISKRK